MPRLRLFICKKGAVDEQAFSQFPVRIGRHPENECCLEDLGVSRYHAELDCSHDGIILRDTGSKNGTTIHEGSSRWNLRGATERFGDCVNLSIGGVSILARLENAAPIPLKLIGALQDASEDLLEACGSPPVGGQRAAGRALVAEGAPEAPEALEAIIDALYRNQFTVRRALQLTGATAYPPLRRGQPPVTELMAALLKWSQTTSVALRHLERVLDGEADADPQSAIRPADPDSEPDTLPGVATTNAVPRTTTTTETEK